MKKIIFIANNNIGSGFSGGDRIFIEFLKNWKDKSELVLFGSEEAIRISKERNIAKVTIIQTDTENESTNQFSLFSVIKHLARRTVMGLKSIQINSDKIKEADYIYSISDFYPDFIPSFYDKLKNPKIKWIAGYYLFAPGPFAKDSPYKGKNKIKGILYWLMQRPSYFIAKNFADIVFVTSEPDVAKFITKKRDKSKILVIQGGVDITESEKFLNSENIIPVENRKYDACFVGRFHFQKGVVGLIDIWKLVCEKNPERKLLMIGDGELESEVKDKIKNLGLENNIELVGFADGEKKFEYFRQSKIMVHPATYDSGGMAAAEGMAWGLPGVSFDLEALKTYYPKGMIKTKMGSNEEFAKNILELINDKNLYEATAKNAHNLIVDVWDWKKRAKVILNNIKLK
jgi:glycosyltransferase involved in cell wall biosynthesis